MLLDVAGGHSLSLLLVFHGETVPALSICSIMGEDLGGFQFGALISHAGSGHGGGVLI